MGRRDGARGVAALNAVAAAAIVRSARQRREVVRCPHLDAFVLGAVCNFGG